MMMKAVPLILTVILLLCLATDAFCMVLKSAAQVKQIVHKLNYDVVDRYLKPFENDFEIPNPELNTSGRLVHSCISQAIKCDDDADCDCSALCSEVDLVEKIRVFPEDEFYFRHSQLSPGTYCLPKGSNNVPCRKNLGSLVYSKNDTWVCVCKYPEIFNGPGCSDLVACKNLNIGNNFGNELWDTERDVRVNPSTASFDGLDFYEVKKDGNPRFICKCSAFDDSRNLLVKLPKLPLQCFVDYCKSGTFNSSVPGYNNLTGECDCGIEDVTRQNNVVPFDKSTACTACRTRYSKHEKTLYFNIPCYVKSTPITAPQSKGYPCKRYNNSVNYCDSGIIKMRLSRK